MSKLLSIVIPAYNEEENIINTAQTVLSIMDREQIPCEVVFVSDGSKDQTYARIQEAASRDGRVRGIEFSRNFGKEAAISAGLATGTGDCLAVMDCDLQHPLRHWSRCIGCGWRATRS
jgi:dolichol-phosphate mannosyltransferase